MTRVRLSRIFWIGAAAILVAAALVALSAVLSGDFSDNDGRILVTLGALLYTGGAALSGLALVDRDRARALGWAVVLLSPICLAFILWAVWSFTFDGDGNEIADKLAWSAAVALLAGLLSTTGQLLARDRALVRLAGAAAVLATLAAAVSVAAVWLEPDGDDMTKAVAVLWILTALSYFLVPVLQRMSAGRSRGRATSVTIKARANGPYRVDGPVRIVDAEGNEFRIPAGSGIVLCRCGQSQTKPFCDSSHKRVSFVAEDTAPRVPG